MRPIRGFTPAAVTVAILGAATLATGVTYATSASRSFHACSNNAGTLAVESHGTCPHGYRKVTVGSRGPRGVPGRSGPGAKSSSVSSTNVTAAAHGPTINLGHGFTIATACQPTVNSYFAIRGPVGTYSFTGTSVQVSNDLGPTLSTYYVESGNQSTPLDTNGDVAALDWTQVATATNQASGVIAALNGTGGGAHVSGWGSGTLIDGSVMITMNYEIYVNGGECDAHIQAIPSS